MPGSLSVANYSGSAIASYLQQVIGESFLLEHFRPVQHDAHGRGGSLLHWDRQQETAILAHGEAGVNRGDLSRKQRFGDAILKQRARSYVDGHDFVVPAVVIQFVAIMAPNRVDSPTGGDPPLLARLRKADDVGFRAAGLV